MQFITLVSLLTKAKGLMLKVFTQYVAKFYLQSFKVKMDLKIKQDFTRECKNMFCKLVLYMLYQNQLVSIFKLRIIQIIFLKKLFKCLFVQLICICQMFNSIYGNCGPILEHTYCNRAIITCSLTLTMQEDIIF